MNNNSILAKARLLFLIHLRGKKNGIKVNDDFDIIWTRPYYRYNKSVMEKYLLDIEGKDNVTRIHGRLSQENSTQVHISI